MLLDMDGTDARPRTGRDRRLQRYWDRHADGYDRQLGFAERHAFGDTRAWVCGQASGETLEVAIGTGLNLPHYRLDVRLTGLDWSPAMLAIAQRRAGGLGRAVTLHTGDARQLPYVAAVFDTVVCTFGLCAVPDDGQVLAEMVRVLRPGGQLLIADHVVSSVGVVRLIQALADAASVPLSGEHFRRRPVHRLPDLGLRVDRQERFRLGLIERVAAVKSGGVRPGPAEATGAGGSAARTA